MTARRMCVGALAAVALTTSLAGCASTNDVASKTSTRVVRPPASTGPPPTNSATTTTTGPQRCVTGQELQSFAPTGPPPPPGAMPPGTRLDTILNKEGRLKVGVDETSPFFSSKNTDTGRFEGLEADLARAIARAIFGDVDDIDTKIDFVTVTTEQKFAVVEEGTVDLMISVPTMSCDRWNRGFNFSAPYYEAFQQLLLPEGSAITSQADLSGKRVCVTSPSSSLTLLEGLNKAGAKIRIVEVPIRPACLIKLQDGKVDAVVLPSSIVAGLRHQDETLHALATPVNDASGKPSTNTYGVVSHEDFPELTLFVNALLERWRADGTLQRLLDANLPAYVPHGIPPREFRDVTS